MSDVGQRAGVSSQTVSRYLNKSGYVGVEARERIEAAVAELGYKVNGLARNLRTSRTNTIGLITVGPLNYGNASILSGLSEASRAAGFSLITAQLELNPREGHSTAEIEKALEQLLALRVDGLIMTTPFPDSERVLDGVWESLPFVTISDRPHAVNSVSAHSHMAGVLATEHLANLGHRAILHLAGPQGRNETEERSRAYQEVMESRKLEVLPFSHAKEWTAAAGFEMADQDPSKFTAVFAANDELAFGFMAAMRDRGRHAPHDYSIIGIDDVPDAEYFYPPLSTVRLDFGDVGRAAFEMLHERIESGLEHAQYLVAPQLIVRKSTRAPNH